MHAKNTIIVMPLSGEPMLKNRNRHDDLRMEHTDFESIAIILIELSLSGEPACFQSLQSCFLFQVNRKKKRLLHDAFHMRLCIQHVLRFQVNRH